MIELHWSWVVGLVTWSVLSKAFGALMFGLWWGERGRRRAAENWKVAGDPEGKAEAVVTAPSKEAEDRFLEAGLAATEAIVDRMLDDQEFTRPLAAAGLSPKQMREHARIMADGGNVEADG